MSQNEELCAGGLHLISRSEENGFGAPEFLTREQTETVERFHRSMESYRRTPLISLDGLAEKLGVKRIFVKDESKRFGLNAFKGLGSSYAIADIICRRLGLDIAETSFADFFTEQNLKEIRKMVFATATDGNHGKGVAWMAGLLGCESYVFMPCGSSELRAQAIRDAGKGHVEITAMSYDDTVRYASRLCHENGWVLVQDTSWPGYEDVPRDIVQGYTTMAREIAGQLKEYGEEVPTHVFLQAGVGAMAGSITGFLANEYGARKPVITIVEPEKVACVYESVKAGKITAVEGICDTIMAGLNCGEPCTLTWPVLRDLADHYIRCEDSTAAYGMRILASPEEGDPVIVSGESGAAGAGVFCTLMKESGMKPLRDRLGLDGSSVVVLISTEGDTDPVSYRKIVSGSSF